MATRLTEYGRIVHYADGMAVTWNGGATFNVYAERSHGDWENTDCFTVYDIAGMEGACAVADAHMADMGEE
jgi:hypothetical protein